MRVAVANSLSVVQWVPAAYWCIAACHTGVLSCGVPRALRTCRHPAIGQMQFDIVITKPICSLTLQMQEAEKSKGPGLPHRWVVVVAMVAAFVLCNMDKARCCFC